MRSSHGRARQAHVGWGGVHLVYVLERRMHGTMAGKEGAAHVRRLRSLCTRTGFDGPKQQEGVRPVLRRGEWGGFRSCGIHRRRSARRFCGLIDVTMSLGPCLRLLARPDARRRGPGSTSRLRKRPLASALITAARAPTNPVNVSARFHPSVARRLARRYKIGR